MCIATFALVSMPVSSRAGDLKNLMSGKTHPLTVKLGELGNEWRRITIHSTGSASGNISVSVTGGSGGTSGSSQNNFADLTGSKVYVTRGQTVAAEGQTYLLAYRMPGNGLDIPGLIQALVTKAAPATNTLTAETVLPLSLLDLKSIGSLDDIRAFDSKREIAESEKLAQTIANALKSAGGSTTNNAPASSQSKPAR
jgi:hypothetical protein